MPGRAVLLDTSFVLALENKDDLHHERAKALDREMVAQRVECVLHWGILLEIADGYARLRRRAKGLQILERLEFEEGFRVVPLDADLFGRAMALYRARLDKEWGLTDCLSFELMQREGLTESLTADLHFRQAGFVALLLA